MHITFAGNTSVSYYCLEKLCRSGFKVEAVILPRKGFGESIDMADFTTLAGEFDFKQIWIPSSKDFKDDIRPDLLIVLEWPDDLSIPVKPSLAAIGSNLQGQYHREQLVDVAADIYNGKSKSEVQLILENDLSNNDFNRQSEPLKDFPEVINFAELEISLFDDVRSVKAKAMARFSRLLRDLLDKLNESGQMPDPLKRQFSQNRIKIGRVINWFQSINKIYNMTRSLTHPGPGAYTWYEGDKINVWRGHYFEKTGKEYENLEPGTVVDVLGELGVLVKAADGLFLITRIQPAGSPELPAWVWAESSRLKIYEKFECPSRDLEIAKV